MSTLAANQIYLRTYLAPFARWREDPRVTDILVNRPVESWIDGAGGLQRVEAMGLGVLVERLCRAREQGGTLALANLGPEFVSRMQELRVDSLFPIFPSVQAALDALVGIQPEAAAALAA